MQVNDVPGEIARPDAAQKPLRVSPVADLGSDETPGGAHRGDQVQISDAGRALSTDAPMESAECSALDPQRAAEIRAKILSGAYDSLSVASDVARAILRSGDL